MTTLGKRKSGLAFKLMEFYSQPQSSPEPFFQIPCTRLCPSDLYFVSQISVTIEQTASFQIYTNYDDLVTKKSISAEHHVKIPPNIPKLEFIVPPRSETEAEM